MTKVTIYHNPRCSKSRKTLELLRDRGVEPEIIEYLKEPPSASEISAIVDKLGIDPKDLIRAKEYADLGLPETDDPEELVRRMADHPQVIERPIVVIGNRARLGRPPEQVLEIL